MPAADSPFLQVHLVLRARRHAEHQGQNGYGDDDHHGDVHGAVSSSARRTGSSQ